MNKPLIRVCKEMIKKHCEVSGNHGKYKFVN